MVTECSFVRAAALDGLAATVATLLEWSRLHHNDGIGFFLITNGAVYIATLRPLFAAPTTMRCAARATS